jgi:hypothetical protein
MGIACQSQSCYNSGGPPRGTDSVALLAGITESVAERRDSRWEARLAFPKSEHSASAVVVTEDVALENETNALRILAVNNGNERIVVKAKQVLI